LPEFLAAGQSPGALWLDTVADGSADVPLSWNSAETMLKLEHFLQQLMLPEDLPEIEVGGIESDCASASIARQVNLRV
jgi:hypothetical protein